MLPPSSTKLGPYEVLAPLGAGGMGEVYRARDSRLNREVAIKVLPAAFARDPERLRFFQQEAQAVAALNHPIIGAVLDFGEHEGEPSPSSGRAVLRPPFDAMEAQRCLKLLTLFGVTPGRRKNHRSADSDRECLLCRFAVKALRREPHRIVSGGGIRMSQHCAVGNSSIAEIPTIGECRDSVIRHHA